MGSQLDTRQKWHLGGHTKTGWRYGGRWEMTFGPREQHVQRYAQGLFPYDSMLWPEGSSLVEGAHPIGVGDRHQNWEPGH